MKVIPIVVFISLTMGFACQRPTCENENPILEKYPIDSKQYNLELAKQIANENAHNLTFWFERYFKKDSREFFEIRVQGNRICAKSIVEITDWNKLENLRRENNGYSGAELVEFKMRFDNRDSTNCIFEDVEKIID